MTRIPYLCGALIFLVAASLRAQKSGAVGRRAAPAEQIILSTRDTAAHVYCEDGGGIADSLRVVITDSASFAEFWRRLVLIRHPDRSPPAIDFGNQEVIVAALGARYASGPRIAIDTVKLQSDVRVVVVRRILPQEDCLDFTQSYYAGRPVDVVVVPRENARATRFVERLVRLNNCGM